MSDWDIQPSGVQSVLSQTEAVAHDFEPQMSALDTALQGAASQCSSGIVAAALEGFAASRQPDLQFLFTRTSACLNGAAQATQAYINGDLEMAANAQAAANAAPNPRPTMPGHGGNFPR